MKTYKTKLFALANIVIAGLLFFLTGLTCFAWYAIYSTYDVLERFGISNGPIQMGPQVIQNNDRSSQMFLEVILIFYNSLKFMIPILAVASFMAVVSSIIIWKSAKKDKTSQQGVKIMQDEAAMSRQEVDQNETVQV
jgi:hypothetical protein